MEIPYYQLVEQFPSPDLCIGNNAKRLLVVGTQVDYSSHHSLLHKILRAVSHDLEEDTHFLGLNPEVKCKLFASEQIKNYDRILVFGIDTETLGLQSSRKAGILRLQDFVLLLGPSLADLSSSESAKRQLWGQLKPMFS